VATSVVQGVATQAGGIGYASVFFRNLRTRLVPIRHQDAAVEPTAANALSGKYPLARFLYVIVNQKPGQPLEAAQRQFLQFLLSREAKTSWLSKAASRSTQPRHAKRWRRSRGGRADELGPRWPDMNKSLSQRDRAEGHGTVRVTTHLCLPISRTRLKPRLSNVDRAPLNRNAGEAFRPSVSSG
jgi:hypothetical protein